MEKTHINPAFDAAIARMDELLAQMEAAVGGQIADMRAVLSSMDAGGARAVRKKDSLLNDIGEQVEEQVFLVLARHQPVAEDLRHAISAMKMAIEYERAGDYIKHLAKSIGRMAAHNDDTTIIPPLSDLLAAVEEMLADFRRARAGGDVDMAVRVWLKDQKVDDLCSDVVRQAFESEKSGQGNVHSLIHSVSAAKNIERLGDKIKNLVEIFYRQKTGETLNIKLD